MDLVAKWTRPSGRTNLKWLDRVPKDLKEVNARAVDAKSSVKWKSIFKITDPRL